MNKLTPTLAAMAIAAAISAQAGPPPAGPQGGAPRFPGGGQAGPGARMLHRGVPMPMGILLWPDVQVELKLNEAQKAELQKLLGGGIRGPGGPGGPGGPFPGGPGQGGPVPPQGGLGQGAPPPPGGGQGGFGPGGQPPQRAPGQGVFGPGGQPGQGGFGPGAPGQGRPGMGMDPEQRQQLEKKIEAVLSDGQYSRYRELALQQQGPQALMDPKIGAEVEITDDQRENIHQILEANRPKRPQGFGGPGRPGSQGGFGGGNPPQPPGGQGGSGAPPGAPGGPPSGQDFEKMRQEMAAQRKKVGDQILAVLTQAQRSKWNAMLGKPFAFKPPQPPRPPQGGPDGGIGD